MQPHLRLLTLMGLWLITPCLFAQNVTLSGKVVDRESKEPLPYASINIKEKTLSTITNDQGEFDFLIPEEYQYEILTISMLGYRNFESPVWSLTSPQPIVINLTKSVTVLTEVTIRDSLTGPDIMHQALKRFEDNFPMKPFVLHSFYRDVKKVGGTYVSVLEAAVKIYDDNYDAPRNKFRLRETVQLIEVRRSLGYEERFAGYFQQGNLLEGLLLRNPIRYHHLEYQEKPELTIKRERDSYYNDHEVYVVTHKSPLYTAKLFIEKENFTFIRVEWQEPPSNKIINREKNLTGFSGGTTKTFDFKRVEGKTYLNYVTVLSKIRWHNNQTNELKFETELHQQLLVNEVSVNTRERILPDSRMRNFALQHQQAPYNKSFWRSYNVIKETPLDRKILDDLEVTGSLNKLFEN
jgi:hypothetical protein